MTITLSQLMGPGSRDLELLVAGVWYPAAMVRANLTNRERDDGYCGTRENGHAEFQYWKDSGRGSLPLTLQASEIPGRVRRSFKDRLLTVEEVEHVRTIGRDEFARAVTIGLAEFEALCRTAKAAVEPTGISEAEVGAIAATIGDWNKDTPKTAGAICSRISGIREHARKLADELNGPAGAREELRSMRYRLAEADKVKADRDVAIKSSLENHRRVLALEDELAKLRGAHRTFLEKEELRRRQEVLQGDLERARGSCKALREERDGAIRARDEAVLQHRKVVDFHTDYVRGLATLLTSTSEERFLPSGCTPDRATNTDVQVAVRICRVRHDAHHERMRRIAIALGMGEISNPAWPAHSDVEQKICGGYSTVQLHAEISHLHNRAAAAEASLAIANAKLAKAAEALK